MLSTVIFCLAACASTAQDTANLDLLLPAPEDIVDPSDIALKQTVRTFLADSNAPAYSRYDFKRVDLDDDGRRDALVLFRNPYGYWCDRHGCTMLVMKADNDSFELVNAVQPIREPLYVSDVAINGWKTLIVRVSGRWSEAKDVALHYDGKKYPDSPANLPPYLRLAANGMNTRVFYDEGT